MYEKSYNYGFMDGFIFAQNGKELKSNDTLKLDSKTIVMGYYSSSEISEYLVLCFKICTSR